MGEVARTMMEGEADDGADCDLHRLTLCDDSTRRGKATRTRRTGMSSGSDWGSKLV